MFESINRKLVFVSLATLLLFCCFESAPLGGQMIDACGSYPCENGATCNMTGNDTYICECYPGYTGMNCRIYNSSMDPCNGINSSFNSLDRDLKLLCYFICLN